MELARIKRNLSDSSMLERADLSLVARAADPQPRIPWLQADLMATLYRMFAIWEQLPVEMRYSKGEFLSGMSCRTMNEMYIEWRTAQYLGQVK